MKHYRIATRVKSTVVGRATSTREQYVAGEDEATAAVGFEIRTASRGLVSVTIRPVSEATFVHKTRGRE